MTINVEIFSSPGCRNCAQATILLRKLVAELGVHKITWREINILNEIDYAVEIGVMSTPSIAINQKLVFASIPSIKNLRAELERQLELHDKQEHI